MAVNKDEGMPSKRSMVERSSNVRTAILDATERLMLEQGYAAVSSRKVASAAGLKSQLLHYYFRTMDDLFIAVFQRMEAAHDERFARAVASEHALSELWKLSTDTASASLIYEFIALATHRKAIKVLMARSAKRDRRMHFVALAGLSAERPPGMQDLPPMILAVLMASVARTLVTESALGVSDGHAETRAFVERYLRSMQSPPRRKKGPSPAAAAQRRSSRSAKSGRGKRPE
jgi:TetR/AcrR family transcriptional regulator